MCCGSRAAGRGSRVAEPRVGVLGSTSLVARSLLPRLTRSGFGVLPCSRLSQPIPATLPSGTAPISVWISTVPLWVLPEQLDAIGRLGARHVIAVGSTSRYTKMDSHDPAEQDTAARLALGEERLIEWASRNGVAWTLLRPTLMYGLGIDRNVSEIARFIRRFGFFPVLGTASGRRQPVHIEDVAQACIAALQAPAAVDRSYNLSGGEVLTYREMVTRVFAALGRQPRLLPIPLAAFRVGIAVLRHVPRCGGWSATMALRMNEDLVFDHADASRDLGFRPRGFQLAGSDLPR